MEVEQQGYYERLGLDIEKYRHPVFVSSETLDGQVKTLYSKWERQNTDIGHSGREPIHTSDDEAQILAIHEAYTTLRDTWDAKLVYDYAGPAASTFFKKYNNSGNWFILDPYRGLLMTSPLVMKVLVTLRLIVVVLLLIQTVVLAAKLDIDYPVDGPPGGWRAESMTTAQLNWELDMSWRWGAVLLPIWFAVFIITFVTLISFVRYIVLVKRTAQDEIGCCSGVAKFLFRRATVLQLGIPFFALLGVSLLVARLQWTGDNRRLELAFYRSSVDVAALHAQNIVLWHHNNPIRWAAPLVFAFLIFVSLFFHRLLNFANRALDVCRQEQPLDRWEKCRFLSGIVELILDFCPIIASAIVIGYANDHDAGEMPTINWHGVFVLVQLWLVWSVASSAIATNAAIRASHSRRILKLEKRDAILRRSVAWSVTYHLGFLIALFSWTVLLPYKLQNHSSMTFVSAFTPLIVLFSLTVVPAAVAGLKSCNALSKYPS